MKATVISIIVLAGVILTTSFISNSANEKTVAKTVDFVIIRYNPVSSNKSTITIYYGGTKTEEILLTKEQVNNTVTNNVADLLKKFEEQGYSLVSTTGMSYEIDCLLRRNN